MTQRADWPGRISAGEDAVADGRAHPALAFAQGLLGEGCRTVPVFIIQAKALHLLGQGAAALAALGEGLADHPTSARLRVERGKILSDLGRAKAARADFDSALATDPQQLEAVKGLLSLQSLAPDDPRLSAVRRLAGDAAATISKRAKACHILGQVMLDAGDLDAGFHHYQQGNDLTAAGHEPKALEYRYPTGTFDITRALIDSLGPPDPQPHCPAILIAGLPRSGKSLVESLLATAPEVLAGGELAILSRYAREFDWQAGAGAVAQQVRAQAPSPLAQRYGAAALGRRFVTETSPTTIFRLGVMALRHPAVPVVLCQRDPQDLCAALYFKQFRKGNLFTTRLEPLGRAIARAERLAQHWQDSLPGPWLAVSYEDMVRDPAATARRLAGLVGLPDPGSPALAPATTRLHPARSTPGALRPDLIGFAQPLTRHFAPAMAAYAAERDRLARARRRSAPL